MLSHKRGLRNVNQDEGRLGYREVGLKVAKTPQEMERANCRVTESASSMLCRAGLWSRREIKQNLTDIGQVMVGCGERRTFAHCGLSRASHFPAHG